MDKRERIGAYQAHSVAGETFHCYIPNDLPPEPPLELEALYPLLDKANIAIGRLDGMSLILPNPALFIYMYVRKEAVLSSQIEGTQSTLTELLLYENQADKEGAIGAPFDDLREVSNYVAAMDYGLNRLKELPLSLRLIREIHEILMRKGRGSDKEASEFRRSQNWIGGSRPGNALYVPPPHEHLLEKLGALELFLHDDTIRLPSLVKAALAHVQFETLHPFLDGNGRIGRLLITFILCSEGLLQEPLLYLSLYFKRNRQAYYDHLQSVRESGDWESWLEFFLTGVIETATQATETAQAILKRFEADRLLIEQSGRATASIQTIYALFQKNPTTQTNRIAKTTGLSLPTVLRSLATLEELGIVQEITGQERHRVYAYQHYLALLHQGTEP